MKFKKLLEKFHKFLQNNDLEYDVDEEFTFMIKVDEGEADLTFNLERN